MKNLSNFFNSIIIAVMLFLNLNVMAQTPFVDLIQPTEPGIEWVVGGTYLISWTDNFQSTADILLSSDGGATYPTTLISGVTGSTWGWNTTGQSVGSNYKIKIQSTVSPGTYFDFSANAFALVDGIAGSITLNQPTGNEFIPQGTSYLISWNDDITAPVKIELLENDVLKRTISHSTVGTTLSWTVPTSGITPDSKIYKIKISSTVAGSTTDPAISGRFTISASAGSDIEVLQPTTGNKWAVGTTHLISWNDDLPEDVKVELWDKSTGTWTQVPQWKSGFPYSAISGSTHSWTIPNSVNVGTKYKIKIISSLDDELYDFSSQFSIKASAGSYVTVLQPVGHEKWAEGTTHLISWIDDLPEDVKLELWDKSTGTWTKVPAWKSGLPNSAVSGSTHSWSIPTSVDVGTKYKIKIISSLDDGIYDFSRQFSITATAGTFVTVLQPNGGEVWAEGTTHLISWNDDLPEDVKLELWDKSTGTWTKVLQWKSGLPYSAVSGSTYSWDIPTSVDVGNKYKIKVISSVDDNISDLSNRSFSITASAGTYVEVLQPNGGENWAVGTSHLISWINDFTEDVKIELWDKSSGTWSLIPAWQSGITSSSISGSTYSWGIPSNLTPGNKYKIKIYSSLDADLDDFSNSTFEITPSAGTFIEVLQPNGGEQWARGTSHLISWTDDLTEDVDIKLVKGGTVTNIASGISGSSYTWNIPSSLSVGSNYKVKIISTLDDNIKDLSNSNFSIIASTGTYITINQPNGGESLVRGSSYLISWTDDFPEDVNIELYRAGSTTTIANGVSGSTYTWNIPSGQTAANNYKVKIYSTLDATIKDFSNSNFSIVESSMMSVYPNPANQNITLNMENHESGEFQVVIFDRFNKAVVKTSVNTQYSNEVVIPTIQLANGVYFVTVTSGDYRSSKKIIIQH